MKIQKTQTRTEVIGVIGAGYVGLVTAATLASLGHEVVVVDVDADKIARLRHGDVPMVELGLPEQHDLEELQLVGFDVREQAQVLEGFVVEALRLVDHQHRHLPLGRAL